MATHLLPPRPMAITACATPSGPHKSDSSRRKTSSSNWWSPLFGWSSDPDYISTSDDNKDTGSESNNNNNNNKQPARSRFAPGCFTEEKAKRLRMLTTHSSSFHDAMYHSAIASRLASDFKRRSDDDDDDRSDL